MAAAREHHAEAQAPIDALPDPELAPRLESLFYLGWAENYLERYEEAIAHVDRGIAIPRASGEGGLLIPLMLVKGYTFEMLGRPPRRSSCATAAVEAARLSALPSSSPGRCASSPTRATTRATSRRRSPPPRRAREVGGRMAGATMPAAAAGRAGRWRCRSSRRATWSARGR